MKRTTFATWLLPSGGNPAEDHTLDPANYNGYAPSQMNLICLLNTSPFLSHHGSWLVLIFVQGVANLLAMLVHLINKA